MSLYLTLIHIWPSDGALRHTFLMWPAALTLPIATPHVFVHSTVFRSSGQSLEVTKRPKDSHIFSWYHGERSFLLQVPPHLLPCCWHGKASLHDLLLRSVCCVRVVQKIPIWGSTCSFVQQAVLALSTPYIDTYNMYICMRSISPQLNLLAILILRRQKLASFPSWYCMKDSIYPARMWVERDFFRHKKHKAGDRRAETQECLSPEPYTNKMARWMLLLVMTVSHQNWLTLIINYSTNVNVQIIELQQTKDGQIVDGAI